jgi:hypothetical protein
MNIVINPTKCTINSITASNKIAIWIANSFKIKLIDNENSAKQALEFEIDQLFLVNGMFAFCDFRNEIIELCKKAKEVIWIANDYAIKFPGNLSFLKGSSKLKRIAQYSNFDNWENHKYVDFNKLLHWNGTKKSYKNSGLFYYGAFRKGRINSFEKWFKSNDVNIHISTASKNINKFKQINNNMHFYKANGDIRNLLHFFQSSIYIEDEFTRNNLMSPANRFYEVIGSKILLFYDVNTKRTLEHAGFWDDDFAVSSSSDIRSKLKNYDTLREKQIVMFQGKDFRKELEIDFKAAL